jgi:hypothetical protein
MQRKFLATVFQAGLFAVIALGLADPAVAQKKKSSGGVIRLEETIIEGRVQKPNAFFINTRQALVYESSELKESFVGEILKAVKDGPF